MRTFAICLLVFAGMASVSQNTERRLKQAFDRGREVGKGDGYALGLEHGHKDGFALGQVDGLKRCKKMCGIKIRF